MTRRYVSTLAWCLGGKLGLHRAVVVAAGLAVFASTPVLFQLVGSDFVPKDDQSEFEIAITMPEGTGLQKVDDVCREIEANLTKLRGITNVFTTIGETNGRQAKAQGDVTKVTIYCKMVDLAERDFGQKDVVADARELLSSCPDLHTTVQEVKLFSGSAFKNVQLELSIRGPDADKLDAAAEKVQAWMCTRPMFTDADTSAAARNPELQVDHDREKAADLGVDVMRIASTLQVLVGGEPVMKY